MRILFAGTPLDVLPVLKTLIAHQEHHVEGILTKPPSRKHRGLRLGPSPVEEKAQEMKLPVWYPSSSHWEREMLPSNLFDGCIDVLITAAYGVKIPENILTLPRYGCVNLHPSLLPRWRGAAPVEHALMAGDTTTGMCIMQTEKTLDTGPILACEKMPIPHDATSGTLRKALFLLGAKMLPNVLKHLPTSTPHPQVGEISLAPAITPADAFLNPQQSAQSLERKVRALMPATSPFLDLWDGEKPLRLNVLKSRVFPISPKYDKNLLLGNVLIERKKGYESMILLCHDGNGLELMQIQREGKKPMSVQNFLRGFAFSDAVCRVAFV